MSRKIVISVDFGTTYSGVAYSDPGNPLAEPTLFTDWGRVTMDKVPTVITYNGPGLLHNLAGHKWGAEVKSHEKRHEWFKLALEDMKYKASTSVDLSLKYPGRMEAAPHYSKKARDYATDYLTSLRKQVISKLCERLGAQAFNALRQEWIITVPAVWSLEGKETTRACAEAAGIGKGGILHMTSEPEAAAAYALRKLEPHNIKIGDNIVICDAGGGTVDLITYRIKRLPPDLQVEESGIPSGGKCGSIFLNRIFEDWVDKKLGGSVSSLSAESREEMMKQFEQNVSSLQALSHARMLASLPKPSSPTSREQQAKREFSDEDEDAVFIPIYGVPNNPAAGITGGRLRITPNEMKDMFEIVVKEVIALVKGQIDSISGKPGERRVAAILLVGGFGESYYLKRRLEKAVGPGGPAVLKPPNAWTAVARGAVMKGLATFGVGPGWRVESRKSQTSYGVSGHWPFKPGHREKYKFWGEYEGEYRCNHIVAWFVKRGDELTEAEPVKQKFYRAVPVKNASKNNFIFEDNIYACMDDQAPTYSKDNCKVLGVLRTDLSVIPRFRLEKKTGKDMAEYYVIDYVVHATFYSASLRVELEYKGEKYSIVQLDYSR